MWSVLVAFPIETKRQLNWLLHIVLVIVGFFLWHKIDLLGGFPIEIEIQISKLITYSLAIFILQGAYEKFSQNILDRFEAYNEAKKTCNTAMERKFCQLSEFVQVKKLR